MSPLIVAGVGLSAWSVRSLILANRRFHRVLHEALTSEAEAEDNRLRFERAIGERDQWRYAAMLAVSDPCAPDVLWSPQDVDGARAHGIDLSRVYEDDRHRGDVL